jgi:hypothetical protein
MLDRLRLFEQLCCRSQPRCPHPFAEIDDNVCGGRQLAPPLPAAVVCRGTGRLLGRCDVFITLEFFSWQELTTNLNSARR